jgi:hypothetical protein
MPLAIVWNMYRNERNQGVFSMRILRKRARTLPCLPRCNGFFGLILILTALLALTACGSSSGPYADDILAHTQTLQITDMTMDMTVNSTYKGNPAEGSGEMKFLVDPARTDAVLTLTVAGTTATIEDIDDISAAVVYARSVNASGATSTTWTKLSVSDNSLSYAQILAFDNLSNTQLIGAETQQGIAVWHIRGDIIGKSITSTGDVYIRKDTYYPVKAVITDSGATPATTTLVYKAFNTGISIAVPPSSQVQDG